MLYVDSCQSDYRKVLEVENFRDLHMYRNPRKLACVNVDRRVVRIPDDPVYTTRIEYDNEAIWFWAT